VETCCHRRFRWSRHGRRSPARLPALVVRDAALHQGPRRRSGRADRTGLRAAWGAAAVRNVRWQFHLRVGKVLQSKPSPRRRRVGISTPLRIASPTEKCAPAHDALTAIPARA
jgi:hypothetical protein